MTKKWILRLRYNKVDIYRGSGSLYKKRQPNNCRSDLKKKTQAKKEEIEESAEYEEQGEFLVKTWTEWETVRHRVTVGGVVTCDCRPLVNLLAEIAPVNENVEGAIKEQLEEIGEDADLHYDFQSVGTKHNGYYFALDLVPGWYVLRYAEPDRGEKWHLFTVQVPKKKIKDPGMIWRNFEISCST